MSRKRMRGILAGVSIVLLGLVFFAFSGSAEKVAPEHNCDFAAVIARAGYNLAISDGETHPEVPWWNIEYDSPADYYIDFVTSRSAESYQEGYEYVNEMHEENLPNPDGYGILYYPSGNFHTGGYWYSPMYTLTPNQRPFLQEPYYTDYPTENGTFVIPMNNAYSAISSAANHAAIVLSHARWGSAGWDGGFHPFTFVENNRTYSFMHNGTVAATYRQAIHSVLYNNGWFDTYDSNWVLPVHYSDYRYFIDSELMFHWFMYNIINHGNSVFAGLLTGLTEQIGTSGLYLENSGTLNFVFCDGSALYVFRNTPIAEDARDYNISYMAYNGYYGVKTQETVGNVIQQNQMVQLKRSGAPNVLSRFPDRYFGEAAITMSDSPDPVYPGSTITYRITITNNGPANVYNTILTDNLPNSLENGSFSYNGIIWIAPWTGSINIGTVLAGQTRTFYIRARVRNNVTGNSIANTASIGWLISSFLGDDPELDNNSIKISTRIVYPLLEEEIMGK